MKVGELQSAANKVNGRAVMQCSVAVAIVIIKSLSEPVASKKS